MKFVIQLHADDGTVLLGEGENVAIAMGGLLHVISERAVPAERHAMSEGLMILQKVGVEADEVWDVSGGSPKPR